MTPCPRCTDALNSHGLYWHCPRCLSRFGRSYKSDPHGLELKNDFGAPRVYTWLYDAETDAQWPIYEVKGKLYGFPDSSRDGVCVGGVAFLRSPAPARADTPPKVIGGRPARVQAAGSGE